MRFALSPFLIGYSFFMVFSVVKPNDRHLAYCERVHFNILSLARSCAVGIAEYFL